MLRPCKTILACFPFSTLLHPFRLFYTLFDSSTPFPTLLHPSRSCPTQTFSLRATLLCVSQALLGSGVSKGAHIARPWRRAARGVAASLFLDS
eukprot:6179524-Pleurochrysis_carterae.AAC.1